MTPNASIATYIPEEPVYQDREDTGSSHPQSSTLITSSDAPQFGFTPLSASSTRSAYSGSDNADASSDSDAISTPHTEPQVDDRFEDMTALPAAAVDFTSAANKPRRASTTLITQSSDDIRRLLGEGQPGTQLIEKFCCGGGCCFKKTTQPDPNAPGYTPVILPDNQAFRSLDLKLGPLDLNTPLDNITPLPAATVSFHPVVASEPKHTTTVHTHPPNFVQPHPPYDVFSAPVYHARELTKPGAEKRTFHFDIDVTDYPDEGGVDFKVGGAIGVCPANAPEVVDDIFDSLGIPSFVRDKPILMKTTDGRWPTIWGDEKPRELVTTRREILTWCTDLQSNPPTKQLLRVLAEYADAKNEKKLLEYLCSSQGQGAFCELRTNKHITISQILHAFPSSKPDLAALLSVLTQLMPRFYSLSNDPHISSTRQGLAGRRLIEIAVSVHESPDWRGSNRSGVGSGFLERIASKFIEAQPPHDTSRPSTSSSDISVLSTQNSQTIPGLRIPMFRGLMANPLSREFVSDGPMMLIGAGVGMAPFRGFILNRLRNANCANKIWLVQGVRDSSVDELYSGELGTHEQEIKKVVQSRRPRKVVQQEAGEVVEIKYVQDEVRNQADVVWFVINALDGRVFVCGSSKGMGEGVEDALIDVAVQKGGLNREDAKDFWNRKKTGGQYIAVSFSQLNTKIPNTNSQNRRRGNVIHYMDSSFVHHH